MILDSSAICAVLLAEPQARALAAAAGRAELVGIGAPTLTETGIVLERRLGPQARGVVTRLLDELDAVVIAFGPEHVRIALDAHARFGRGRHPAGLTFGDCMSYATARHARRPLLCVGDDFAATDLPLVPVPGPG